MVRRNTFNMPLSEKGLFYMSSLYLMIRGVCTLVWAFLGIREVVSPTYEIDKWLGVWISLKALFVIGIVLIVFAFFVGGFSILYFENAKFRSRCTCCISCTTVMFALLFLAMLIVQSSAGSYMLAQISRMQTFVGSFARAFWNYNYRTEDMELVNHIQETLNCCGINSYHDYWNILNIAIPASCCYKWEEPWKPCSVYKAASDGCVYKLGLVPKLATIQAISIVALIVVVVELIGFIFILRLMNSRRKRNAMMQYAASSGNNPNKIFPVSGEIYKRSM